MFKKTVYTVFLVSSLVVSNVSYGRTHESFTENNKNQVIKVACAENGSCSGDISKLTQHPKRDLIKGYSRKDGTYVRDHYKSYKSK